MTLHDTPASAETADETEALDSAPTGSAPLPPIRAKGTSMKLAMIVPGLGALILVIFIGAEILTTNPVQPVKTSTKSSVVTGTNIRATPAVDALKPIISAGEPPGNIINAVSLPKGFTELSHQNNTASAGEYDAQIELRADLTQGALFTFYKDVMKKQGWAIFDTGAASNDPGGIEVLAKQAGSDGFYWEMGAVVQPTSFGSGAPASGWTDFTVRLFQVPDPE
jgi:hypothetical protein